MDRLQSSLMIASYNGMKHYNFHDCLAALSKHVFINSCEKEYEERKERIAS